MPRGTAKRRSDMKLTFKYLDIKGLGEPIRLALTVGGLPFEDVRLSYDDVVALKGVAGDLTKHNGSPFGQVPVLEIDGRPFGQSGALLRWVGRECGLYPSGMKQLRVDMVEDTLADVRRVMAPNWYKNAMARKPKDGKLPRSTMLSEQQVSSVRWMVQEEYLPERMWQIERLLMEEKDPDANGWFVCGKELSIADLSLYVMLEGLLGMCPKANTYCKGITAEKALMHCPRLVRLIKEVANHPKIAAWNKEKWGEHYDEGMGGVTADLHFQRLGLNLRPKPKTEPKKQAEPVNPLKFLLIVALYVVFMILVVQFILPGRTGGFNVPKAGQARRSALGGGEL